MLYMHRRVAGPTGFILLYITYSVKVLVKIVTYFPLLADTFIA